MTLLESQQATALGGLARARRAAALAVSALRPRQWTKNLLLFAGLIFAKRFDAVGSWAAAIAIFSAFCALSSSAYLLNDGRDVEHDRAHPTKRLRPIASGELPVRSAYAAATALLVAGLAIGVVLGLASFGYLAAFAAVQVAYTLLLKRIVLVDVLTIAGLFVLRAAAGAAAVNVHISPWLLACTALLALFLGLAKRRSELMLVAGERAPGRPVLQRYSVRMLDRLLGLTAAAVLGVYSLYSLTVLANHAMVVTVPFVVAGLARYLHLIHRHELGEEPEEVLLTDGPILACVGCWALTAALVLALS